MNLASQRMLKKGKVVTEPLHYLTTQLREAAIFEGEPGKTWLACAFGQLACRLGFSVRYLRLLRLFEQLRIEHGDGSYLRLLQLWANTALLILDDWGLDTLTPPERKDLLELMDDRHGLHSTLITSQLPLEHWPTYLGDPTVADAILDRLLHNAHKIHLKGESMRKTNTTLTQRDPSE